MPNWKDLDLLGKVHRLSQSSTCEIKSLPKLLNRNRFDWEFDSDGNLTRRTAYTHGGTTAQRVSLEYSHGLLIRSVQLRDDGDEVSTSTYVYDDAKRCVQIISLDSNGDFVSDLVNSYAGDQIVTSKFKGHQGQRYQRRFFYDRESLAFQETVYFSSEGVIAERSLNYYDQLGRLGECFGLKPDDSPLGDGRYEYVYDERGLESRVFSFNDLAESGEPTGITTRNYEFDQVGNWVTRVDASWSSEATCRVATITRSISYF